MKKLIGLLVCLLTMTFAYSQNGYPKAVSLDGKYTVLLSAEQVKFLNLQKVELDRYKSLKRNADLREGELYKIVEAWNKRDEEWKISERSYLGLLNSADNTMKEMETKLLFVEKERVKEKSKKNVWKKISIGLGVALTGALILK